MQGMLNPGEPQMQGMAQAGRNLWRSFSPSSYPKQDQHQMQVKLLRAWAEGGQSTDSLVPYFHAKPLSWWWFFFLFLMWFFFFLVFVIAVPHPFIMLLREELGSFPIISFQAVEDNKHLFSFLTPQFEIPQCFQHLCMQHVLQHPIMLMAFGWALPGMSANHVASCWCHQLWVRTFTLAQVTHTRVW